MKKIFSPILFLCSLLVPAAVFADADAREGATFVGSLSSGFVFKHDCAFKAVYGSGMVNIITADGCYYPWCHWGIGGKISYFRATGKTAFLQECTRVQEVPVTFYLRRTTEFSCGAQLYASLGGGFVWLKEKSYLADIHLTKGIGEAEVGLYCPLWRCITFTSAFRYLFPRQTRGCAKIDVGGFDLRAGLGVEF